MDQLFIYAIIIGVIGACIGSFLNVVIFRMPEEISLVTPPSHCPACKYHLAWYDNIPIVSWFVLDAKCRNCGAKISAQYPLIEGGTALLFVLTYLLYYGGGTYQAMSIFGLENTGLVFATHIILISVLIAATIIDARLFIIPKQLPETIVITAVVLQPLAAAAAPVNYYLVPTASGRTVGLALGAGIGLVIANLLLHYKIIPRTFVVDEHGQWVVGGKQVGPAFGPAPAPESAPAADASAKPAEGDAATPAQPQPTPTAQASAEPTPADPATGATDAAPAATPASIAASPETQPEQWIRHPDARGEVTRELIFLAIPLVCAIIGYFLVPSIGPTGTIMDALGGQHTVQAKVGWMHLPMWQHILAGTVLGAAVGGAVAWFFRIVGTYIFGKEAMGLGDVHILAAIGAVVGAQHTVFIFFFAAVLGLIGAIATGAVNNLLSGKGRFREIPFGPYLALATLISLLAHDPVTNFVDNVALTVGSLFSGKL